VDVLVANVRFVGWSLVPALWLAIPFTLLVIHLEPFFGYRGLRAGEPAILKAHLIGDTMPSLTLDVADGLRVETPPLWRPAVREVDWRLSGGREGSFTVGVRTDGHVAAMDVLVSSRVARPTQRPLESGGPIQALEIIYPVREYSLLGWPVDWAVMY